MGMRNLLVCAAMATMLIAGTATPVSADSITVENFSFELPGDGKIKGWDEADGAYYTSDSSPAEVPGWEADGTVEDSGVESGWSPTDGDWTGFLMGSDPSCYQLTNHIIISGETIVLKVDAENNWDGTELTISLYYDDGGSRVTAASSVIALTDGNNAGDKQEYTLTFASNLVPASAGHRLGIELDNTGAGANWVGFDNVRLESDISLGPTLVYPVDEENIIDYTPTLQWNAPIIYEPGRYYIYLDPNQDNVTLVSKMVEPDPGSPLHINVSQLGSDPNEYTLPGNKELDPGVRYYWKVESQQTYPGEDPNYFSSNVTSFTTMPELPVITQQPQNMTVPKDTDGVFEVGALNTEEYHWFKVQPGDDLEVGEPNIPTLTINVQKEDEGFYYCVCSNAKGDVSTDTARLMVQRRVALWNFDDQNIHSDIENASEEDYFPGYYLDPNDSTPDPEFANSNPGPSPAGGYYIIFEGDTLESEDDNYGEAILAEPNEFFNFYPQGVTASAWVQVTGIGTGWTAAVSKHDPDWIGWILQQNDNHGVFTARQTSGSGDVHASTDIDISGLNEDTGDNWHLLTGTYGSDDDGDGSIETRIYVNGNLETEAESAVVMQTHTFPLVIGAENSEGFSPWDGRADYVEIYNYPLSRFAVAKKYTDWVPGADVCIEDLSDTDMDFNDDCIVDVKDLHMFATEWLNCYIVPTCTE